MGFDAVFKRYPSRLAGALAATLVATSTEPARAQPATRGQPVLRTPPTRTPPSGTLGAGGKPGDDPLSALQKGNAGIAFEPKPGSFAVNFNLDDADLPDLVKAIAQVTGKRFIFGGRLRQIKATVVSPEKITADEAYRAFLSILAQNGMTVIPHGRFLKIVETPGVVTFATPLYGPAQPVPAEDRYVTRLIRLQHIDATDASTVLGKFKSRDGDITVYPPGNLLIVTETGSNIARMMRILEEVDVGGAGEQLWVEKINYTSATELANKLNEILDLKKPGEGGGFAGGRGGRGGAPGVVGGETGPHIVADDHDNALIITATEPDYLRLLELIKPLDQKPSGEGEIHVQPLQHAMCKDISQTLNQLLGTSSFGMGAGSRGRMTPGMSGARGVNGAAGSGIDQVFEGRVRITCDEATNSIVTTSSGRDYAQLHAVIDKLDHPRRQVFIEAVIMDVSVQRQNDYGVAYHAGAPTPSFPGNLGQGVLFGGNSILSSISPTGLAASDPNALSALAVGVQGPPIPNSQNIFGTGLSIPALGVVLHAMEQDGDNNVLATPHILALDNQDATISIGQNIPLQQNVGGGLGALASQAGGAAGALGGGLGLGLLGGGFSAPRQDIGTKIKIKPHVNDSDQIRLELLRGGLGRRRAPGRARRHPHQQAHGGDAARGPRSADGGHRRPRARRHHQRRDQDPDPRRHPGARLPLQAEADDQDEVEPPPPPHAVRHPQPGGPARHLRAQDAGAAGVHRSLLRVQRGRDVDPAEGFPSRQRPARGHPPVDARRGRQGAPGAGGPAEEAARAHAGAAHPAAQQRRPRLRRGGRTGRRPGARGRAAGAPAHVVRFTRRRAPLSSELNGRARS